MKHIHEMSGFQRGKHQKRNLTNMHWQFAFIVSLVYCVYVTEIMATS